MIFALVMIIREKSENYMFEVFCLLVI